MKKKMALSVLAMSILLSLNQSVYASVEGYASKKEAGDSSATVYADIDANYSITLPKTIKLDASTKDAEYTVKVKGGLAGPDVLHIVPDASFAMTSDGKDDITATITQEKTEFTSAELEAAGEDGISETGTISAQDMSAGRWDGTFHFNVSKSTVSGLYKDDGSYVSWQQLLDNGILNVDGNGILTSGTVDKYKHTNTSSDALSGELIIDESVKSIGDYGFHACENLTGVEVPEGITSLGNQVFSYSAIQTIELPESITKVGDYVLGKCSNLTRAIIKCSDFDSSSPFDECENLQYVKISDNVKKMHYAAFRYSAVQTLVIGGGMTQLPDSLCYGCKNLTNVVLSDGLLVTGSNTFQSCTALKEVTLPSTLTTISALVFADCSALETVVVPDSVTAMGPTAFLSCKSLKNVTIPDGVTELLGAMFLGCENLDLTVPDSVTTIGDAAFTNVKHITYHGTATYPDDKPYWGAKSMN